jgi:pyruvate/2-oxoglutarate/acetoin dehydrogenase E1 component
MRISPVLWRTSSLYLIPVYQPEDQSDLDVLELKPEKGLFQQSVNSVFSGYPAYQVRVRAAPSPVLTMVAYGYMAELCRQALLRLAFEEEIFAELFIPTQLAPFQLDPVLDSARRTGRLLAVEEEL